MSAQPHARHRHLVPLIVLLTLAGFALRAFHMTAQSLWYDEMGSARVAATPVAELLRGTEAQNADGGEATDTRPVEPTAWLSTAYYALVKAVLSLPHESPEGLMRLTSVVVGTATVPALAWATYAFVPTGAVLATTGLLAISPFHVWYSQEVRPYALLVLLAVLAVGAYVRALATNGAGWWALVTVLLIIALYTHPIALALPAIAGLGVLATGATSPRRALPGFAAVAAAVVAFVPLVLWIGKHGANNPADLRPVGWFDVPYAFFAYAVGFSLGPSTAELHAGTIAPLLPHLPVVACAAVVFGALALRGALATGALPPVVRVVVWSWLAVPFVLALVVAIGSANPFNVRYAIVSFPAFVLFLGLGAAAERPFRGLAIAATALSFVALANLYFDPRYAKEDSRGLAEILRAEASADDLVVVNAAYMADAVSYYYRGPATVLGYPESARRGPLDPATTSADLDRLAAGRRHVWLVETRTFHGDATGTLRKALEAARRADRRVELDGIVAERYAAN